MRRRGTFQAHRQEQDQGRTGSQDYETNYTGPYIPALEGHRAQRPETGKHAFRKGLEYYQNDRFRNRGQDPSELDFEHQAGYPLLYCSGGFA
jgi:hypothetical protein